jgi:hypothetical protein
MRAIFMTIMFRTCLLVLILGCACSYVAAQKDENRKNAVFASCVAQTVLTDDNRHGFISDGQIKYRVFNGGIPYTNQAKEHLKTIVLFSKNGTRSIVASATGGPNNEIVVGRFFDLFEFRNGSWTAIDAEGGPGTAEATAEFIQKLVKDVPLANTKLQRSPQGGCHAEE